MGEDRRWMYEGWRKTGNHTSVWVQKTTDFVNNAFSLIQNDEQVRCPCSKCRNCQWKDNKKPLSYDLCKYGFMPNYEVWVYNGESRRRDSSEDLLGERGGNDRMREMIDDLRPDFFPEVQSDSETDHEDPPTQEVQKFFELLKASEEPLHDHTTVTILAFVTRIIAIKSKFAFSNNCYKEILKLISDILPANHKMPKDMYQSRKLLSGLGMDYEKIDVYQDNCMLFWKEHKNEKKCIKCAKSRYVEVVNEDGETITTEVAYKQLRYMTPRLKRLFLSKNTAQHMRWHK